MDQHAYDFENPPTMAPAVAARQRPERSNNPAGEVGWYLTQERLRRGIGLEAASNQTGIHPSHIFAIEHGDMTRMPARVEALEMIAAYANFLGFDPEPLLKHYVTFLPAPELAPKRHPADPAPMSSAKVLKFGKEIPKIPSLDLKHFKLPSIAQMPGGQTGVIASIAAAFIVFAGAVWMLSGPSEVREPVDLTADVQPSIAVPEPQQQASTDVADPMPTATTGPESADVTVTEAPLASQSTAELVTQQPEASSPMVTEQDDLGAFIQKTLNDDGPQTGSITPADTPVVTEQVATAAKTETETVAPQAQAQTATATPAQGEVFGSTDPNARLVIQAMSDVWVRIEDARGEVVITQGLKKGDVYRVPDQKGLTIIAKDGGLLSYFIDGQNKGLLGKPGEFLANEALDPAKLAARG